MSEASDLINSPLEGGRGVLSFEISDTGSGIAPEEQDRVFEAFTQTATGLDAQEGTGLGLTICRKFVQLMGGDIQIQSESGKGATFSFTIPVKIVATANIDQQPQPPLVLALEAGQPEYRLLIADDNSENRKFLAELLNLPGFQVREACNGQEAIEIWQEWKPDLIWMDMRMPVMNGYDAVKVIRHEEVRMKNEDSGSRHCQIIAISASVFEEERATAIAQGCDDFLRKPFRESEIFDLLRQHLAARFVYEEEQEATEKKHVPTKHLPPLSSEWRKNVEYAAKIADFAQLARLIEAIRPRHTVFAAQLSKCLENFEYTAILKLIQEDQNAASRAPAGRQDALTPEALAVLPEAWRMEFRDAVEGLYIEQTQTLIDRIRGCNAPLADALAALLKDYRFDRLLDYVERSGGGNLS